MSLRVRSVTILLLSTLATPLTAQERLTLNQAVTTALARNPLLGAADSTVRESEHRVTEARAGFYPRVVFSESWQRSNGPVFAFSSLLSARRFSAEHLALDALNHPQPVSLFRAALGLDYQVFDGGRRRSAVQVAELTVTSAQAERDEAAARLAVDTTRAFGRIVSADAAARAADAAHAAAAEDLSRVRRRRELGVASEADVLAVVVHLADLEQRAIQAAGDAGIARAELNRLMGSPVEATFDVVEPVQEAVATGTEPVAALLAEADERRPELRRAVLGEQLADAERRQARAAIVPRISTQVFTDLNGTSFTDRASAWLAGAEVRWDFSLGGAETAALKAGAERVIRARAQAQDTRASVHVEVLTAFRRLESARARLLAGQAAADQAREQQRIIRDRYDAGLAAVNDVLQVSAAVLTADANRTEAMVDAIVSRAELRRAVGRSSN